jgi:sigma-B regulation protein RsbU (phosphoserine phosphatase)
LEVAQEVQQNFFPESDPNIPGLDISPTVLYCEETGGDYIDLLREKDGTVGIIVGDVTGHGIGAALLMATARALMRGHYQTKADLTQIMNAVNRGLTTDIGDTGRFVTLFFLEVDLQSYRLKWVRAGHDPAWLFSANDGSVSFLDGPGMALGVSSAFRYAANVGDLLGPGDIILIGTDGIWETTNTKGVLFGKRRLERAVLENAHRTAAEISTAVMGSVIRFRGDAKQEDDVSILVVKRP